MGIRKNLNLGFLAVLTYMCRFNADSEKFKLWLFAGFNIDVSDEFEFESEEIETLAFLPF